MTSELVVAGPGSDFLPVPPVAMSEDEIEQAHRCANELMRDLRESSGGRQLAVLDEVTSVGVQSQRNAGRQLELIRTRLGTFLDEGGASKDVAMELVGLRAALDRINPEIEQQGFVGRVLRCVPFMGNRMMVRSLKKIAMRSEPVSKQVLVIETKLRLGRTLLARDNVELRRLYDDVEAQQHSIERQTFLAELLTQQLASLLAETDDPLQQNRLQAALHDVAMRLQDMRAMQEVHVQYFVSIELTHQNNNRLGQAVDRTLALAMNVVTIGLAIQAALMRQRIVKEATERTREFLGDMIEQNAEAIRRQTEEIGDLYNEPVIAMDKLVAAHHDLLSALDTARQLRQQGLITAHRSIEELTGLTRELTVHVQGLDDEASGRRR